MHPLSLPTWIIHILGVFEWTVAIWLVWSYAHISRNSTWRWLSLAMLPALVSALCACTWHLFNNAPTLMGLVTLQAVMTLLGNSLLCWAAWLLWKNDGRRQLSSLYPLLPLVLLGGSLAWFDLSKTMLFALSLFPYLGFLWFLTRSRQAPRLALTGFYMTLIFACVTIAAGIYAQVRLGQSLANVDFLHGSAEAVLMVSNILVVLGFRQAIIAKRRALSSSSL